MKIVKQTAEYTILERRDGRYAVRGGDKKHINGDAKVEILAKEGLIKEPPKAKPAPEPEETPAGESADAPGEEETPAEEDGGDS
jgi:hypothetical protein